MSLSSTPLSSSSTSPSSAFLPSSSASLSSALPASLSAAADSAPTTDRAAAADPCRTADPLASPGAGRPATDDRWATDGQLATADRFAAADRFSSCPLPSHPPGTEAPEPCEVPHFAPVRVRGGRYRLRRLLRQRGRAVAAGLAVTAAALVAAGPRLTPDADAPRGAPARGHPRPSAGPAASVHGGRPTDTDRTVTVPVRVADAATVRLLRPGDRVDVIAVPDPATGGRARVVASGARVRRAPESLGGPGAAAHMGSATGTGGGSADGGGTDSALVTLAVPRSTAAQLAGAGATARLAVTLW
nr:hypothetical protein StreXyl84_37040 [Streptomyces sp. Xyl84]